MIIAAFSTIKTVLFALGGDSSRVCRRAGCENGKTLCDFSRGKFFWLWEKHKAFNFPTLARLETRLNIWKSENSRSSLYLESVDGEIIEQEKTENKNESENVSWKKQK